MAIRKIRKDPDPILRKISRRVDVFDWRLWQLLDDMADTLRDSDGVGLAAVQVGVLRRIVIVDTGKEILELINPEIISSSGMQEELEGCLSFPGQFGITQRPMIVKIKAQNRKGETYEYTGEGLIAKAFCHETEHLDGKLFIDKCKKILSQEELDEYIKKQSNKKHQDKK